MLQVTHEMPSWHDFTRSKVLCPSGDVFVSQLGFSLQMVVVVVVRLLWACGVSLLCDLGQA